VNKYRCEKVTEEKTTEKENTKEKEDWFATLFAEGVKSANRDNVLFDIDPNAFHGNRIALMKGQEQRAVAILKKVAENEFPGLKFEIDDHDVPYTTYFHITTRGGLRTATIYYIYLASNMVLSIYTDKALEDNARRALNKLLFEDDA